LAGLNDWAGLAPQLLGGLEPESLQEFTPMPATPMTPLPKLLGGRDPRPPGLTPLIRSTPNTSKV